jgi:hypothetical protein
MAEMGFELNHPKTQELSMNSPSKHGMVTLFLVRQWTCKWRHLV